MTPHQFLLPSVRREAMNAIVTIGAREQLFVPLNKDFLLLR